jgi:hypothetical protein
MSDIIAELRERSLRAEQEGDPLALLDEAADEIELLRGYRDAAEADAAVARLLLDRLRLTDAEREAVAFAVEHLHNGGWGTAVLRGLLSRTGLEQADSVAETPEATANVAEKSRTGA